jgi:pilus assembly protein Flp/PilA
MAEIVLFQLEMPMESKRRAADLWRDRRGAQLVEYLLVVGLVSLLAMAGARAFGHSVSDKAQAHARAVERLQGTYSADGATGEHGGESQDDGGGLWGAVEGIAGDAADLGGDALDLAGDAFSEAMAFKKGFERGLAKGAWGVVTGIAGAVTHPVRTVEALHHASTHPFETVWSIGDIYVDQVAANPAEGLGVIAFDAGVTLLTSGAASPLAQGSKASKVAKGVEITDNTTTAASASTRDDGVPGFVKWADRHIAPNLMPHFPRLRLP